MKEVAMTTTNPNLASPAAQGLLLYLGANLPGLSDNDLADLVAEVGSELELRTGTILSDGLTAVQLDEFEQLVDSGDDAGCATWLAANRPHYRATVMIERARLIAEVVEAVATADPSAAAGERHIDQTVKPSMDLLVSQLTADNIDFMLGPDGALRVDCEETDTHPLMMILIRHLVSPRGMFVFTGFAPSATAPLSRRALLDDFAAEWNRSTWMPKAVVTTDDDAARCRVVSEIVVTAGAPMTRAYVQATMRRCFASTFSFFRDAQAALYEGLVTGDSD